MKPARPKRGRSVVVTVVEFIVVAAIVLSGLALIGAAEEQNRDEAPSEKHMHAGSAQQQQPARPASDPK